MGTKLFRLNKRDLFKGAIVAILTGLFTSLASGFAFDIESLKVIGIATISSLAAYLLKNLSTNTQGEILTPDKDEN